MGQRKKTIYEKSSLFHSKVLVLDDSRRSNLGSVLEKEGFTNLTRFDSKKEFYRQLNSKKSGSKQCSFDLAILALSSPFQDNIHICRKLSQIRSFNRVPFIVVTADRKNETLKDVFNVGASDYVCRPVRVIDLLSRISITINRFRNQILLKGSTKELAREIKEIKRKEKKLLSLEEAVENMPLGLTIADKEGDIVYSNPAEALIHGYSPQELLGKPARKFSAKRFWKSHTPEKLRNFSLLKRETDNIRKDGTVFPVQLTSSVVRDDNDEPLAIVTICEDITERKKIESELKSCRENLEVLVEERTVELRKSNESLKKLSEAVKQCPSIVMITDTKGRIEYVNPVFEEMTLYSPHEVTGKKASFLKADSYSKDRHERIWDRIKKRRLWKGEVCSNKKDGEKRWEKVSISPLINDEGDLSHFIIVSHDITKLKEATEKLKAAKKQAEDANKAKSDFVMYMSHELRTPLSSIVGISELLSNDFAGKLKERQRELVGDIYESGQHLLNIVNDLLDLKIIEEKKMVLKPSAIDVNSLLGASAAIFRDKMLVNDKQLIIKTGSDVDFLFADERRIKQVLINLIGNASKFTPAGGTITIKAESFKSGAGPLKKQVKFSIMDTGPGIKKKDMNRLFKPFEQLAVLSNDEYKGTGLGLVLSKNIVELHGGKIWVESKWGEGSNFIFTLPAQDHQNQCSSQAD